MGAGTVGLPPGDCSACGGAAGFCGIAAALGSGAHIGLVRAAAAFEQRLCGTAGEQRNLGADCDEPADAAPLGAKTRFLDTLLHRNRRRRRHGYALFHRNGGRNADFSGGRGGRANLSARRRDYQPDAAGGFGRQHAVDLLSGPCAAGGTGFQRRCPHAFGYAHFGASGNNLYLHRNRCRRRYRDQVFHHRRHRRL